MVPLIKDAHNHLHYSVFSENRAQIIESALERGITQCVVNGTCEQDWDEVLKLWQAFPHFIIPAIGIHPWKSNTASPQWFDAFQGYLKTHPQLCVGEIGLDKWIHDHDIQIQREHFSAQLALAAQLDRPVTIHCLKAWGHLIELLDANLLPQRGIHIHGFGGSSEVFEQLKRFNPYFSFSGYFLHQRKHKVAQVYRSIPLDRLLIETDAPDMLPPNRYLSHPSDKINFPENLAATALGLSELLEMPLDALAEQTSANFDHYFST